ncbi:hypothetical protein [Novipirellula maiorica]|nr:hypothetical protein [Rhodopirellula maiorica]
MKTIVMLFSLTCVACVFAYTAQSNELTDASKVPRYTTSAIGKELLQTLDIAFSLRLAEYKEGRAGVEHAIRLNTKLYQEQIGAADGKSRRLVAENYLKRAKEIETIAKINLDNGTGTSQELFEAKAGRLSATLELAKF